MIIMALDHTRDFIHVQAFTSDPLDLNTTTPILFFTRWITHFCAPVFVFLSGTSGYLQSLRKPKKELSAFFMKRGLWLIVVELVIMTFGISFDIHYSMLILQVIWAIGISMFLLGLLIWLPFPLLLGLGLIIVLGHNSLDFYESSHKGNFSFIYTLIHRQGGVPLTEGHVLDIFYPFLPWTGVMILGYCFGKFYLQNVMKRNKRALLLGIALVTLFIVLRAINIYGDPLLWSKQKSVTYTILSFLNTQKYPPSLLYLCMTIGPSLILLGAVEDVNNKFSRFVTVFGKVPLFYYILHFYILHLISTILYLMRGHTFKEGMTGLPGFPFKFVAPGEGYSLLIVYFVWIALILVLYPVCRWYAGYKMRNRNWWLGYL